VNGVAKTPVKNLHQLDKFEYLLPYAKSLLRPDEAADVIGFERNKIYTLILEGKLEAHAEERDRPSYRVTRRSVLAYLAKTAQYEPDDFLDVIEVLIKTLSGKQIDQLVVRARRIREGKS
jgi:excisionase family DNA binding protein